MSAVAASMYEWVSRPRVRLTIIGVILLLIGGLLSTSSVWTLPLVVVGSLMVAIAWIGHRLEGRFAVEWGEAGTQIAFRAQIRTARHARPAVIGPTTSSHELVRAREPGPEQAEIIDGEAHTVEIDVAELEALIAAVEITSGKLAHSDASAQAARNLRRR